MRALILIISTIFSINAHAGEWTRLTTEQKKSCTRVSPCRFETKDGKQVRLHFESKQEPERNMHTIKQIFVKVGKAEAQKFNVAEAARMGNDEAVEIYAADLKGDGTKDLALLSMVSPKDGSLYYYLIYDAKKQKFTLSAETAPKIEYKADKNAYVGVDDSSYIYKLDSENRLKLDVKASQSELTRSSPK